MVTRARTLKAGSQTLTATANAAGVATVTFQSPLAVGGFTISTIDLRVTGSVPIPLCVVSMNGQTIAVKRAGDRGQLIGEGDVLFMGQQLQLQWSLCDPGAICEATLTGTG